VILIRRDARLPETLIGGIETILPLLVVHDR
jgi:hypothetical protein